MANLASFGTKEYWMEPMNSFLNTHRDSFKMFIDDVCYVPAPIASLSHKASTSASPAYAPGYFSSETNLSYTTPMTIMQRLPPTSREGFPSLPYLIDQARAFADLVQLWLEAINPKPSPLDNPVATHTNPQRKMDILHAVQGEPDFAAFNDACEELNFKTLESLNRAERADPRPSKSDMGTLDPIALIDSLHDSVDGEDPGSDDAQTRRSLDLITSTMVSSPTILPREMAPSKGVGLKKVSNTREWDHFTDDEGGGGRLYNYTSRGSISASASTYDLPHPQYRDRPGSAGFSGSVSNLQDSFRRVLASRGSDHSPMSGYTGGGSTVSSAVSSDTEHATTALPSYEREIRHRERRAHARELITQHVEQAKLKAAEKKEKKEAKPKTPLAALRKKRREKDGGSSAIRQEDHLLQQQQQQQHDKSSENWY
nr:hypothetical protein CFP56_41272 [Quercus suber]